MCLQDLERALAEAEREMNLQRAGEIKCPTSSLSEQGEGSSQERVGLHSGAYMADVGLVCRWGHAVELGLVFVAKNHPYYFVSS